MAAQEQKEIVIEFQHVSLSFDGKRALDDVSFTLKRGGMTIITGDSGSGKSVLLRLAIGLLRPDSGRILIEGQEVEEMTETELLSLRSRVMGLVFQEDALFTGMSVYDNTAYRLVEHGLKEEDVERSVTEILRFVGLEKDMEKLPEELSIGMRKRLELARALVGWPSIMLFDEPTSGLDPINARHILDLIIRARDIYLVSSLLVSKELHQIPHLVKFCAVRDNQGAVRISSRPTEEATGIKIMALERGRIAFEGNYEEFERSDLPAVKHLTNPESGMRKTDSFISDPWKRKLPPEDKLL
ncbi:MAG TPA: ATP-binding cassette domain-containing protein [Blastocatellia bacterium]|jgi:phospholipid/cholesterol/gamma-HCH transport system ATP-binding protein